MVCVRGIEQNMVIVGYGWIDAVGCLVISPYSKRGISKAFHSQCEPGEVLRSERLELNPVKARDAASDDIPIALTSSKIPCRQIELGIWNRGNGSAAAGGNPLFFPAGQIVRLATLASHGSPDQNYPPRLQHGCQGGSGARGPAKGEGQSEQKRSAVLPCRISR